MNLYNIYFNKLLLLRKYKYNIIIFLYFLEIEKYLIHPIQRLNKFNSLKYRF